MTIAIDIRTGAVVGQVTDTEPARTEMRAGAPFAHLIGCVRIFTREGYRYIPRSSVRFEELR